MTGLDVKLLKQAGPGWARWMCEWARLGQVIQAHIAQVTFAHLCSSAVLQELNFGLRPPPLHLLRSEQSVWLMVNKSRQTTGQRAVRLGDDRDQLDLCFTVRSKRSLLAE